MLTCAHSGDVITFQGQPQPISSVQSGAYFHKIPNPAPGGPTHMINAGSAGPLLLGSYDPVKERMMLNDTLGLQPLNTDVARWHSHVVQSSAFQWAAVGDATGE